MPKVDYAIRETASNLTRNFTITLASVMTVVVSLALVGASLMLRQGVQNATRRWQGGIEFVVFMKPNASQEQTDNVKKNLQDNPRIQKFTYVDQKASYVEFKQLFHDQPELIASVNPSDLPPSYRVVPIDKTEANINDLGKLFGTMPGVKEVSYASATIRAVQELSQRLTVGIIVVALVLLGAAILLILNTIRMAMFARRREIEVMKLVGATNWFVRGPFMLEGLICGVAGSLLAIFFLILGKAIALPEILPHLSGDSDVKALAFPETALILLGMGLVLGAVGSGLTIRRFLRV